MVNHLQANLVQMLKVATVTFVTFQQAKGPVIDNFEKKLGPLGPLALGPLGFNDADVPKVIVGANSVRPLGNELFPREYIGRPKRHSDVRFLVKPHIKNK